MSDEKAVHDKPKNLSTSLPHDPDCRQKTYDASPFDRTVIALLGLPFDVLDRQAALAQVHSRVLDRRHCFISTPNLNFVMTAQRDEFFRDSVLHSQLSLIDGQPLVWLAQCLGLPIKERVSGASLFEQLCAAPPKIRVFFWGGAPHVAKQAHEQTNLRAHPGVESCGYCDPGMGSVEQMSQPELLARVNQARADFLIVALGAQKGQAWIMANFEHLNAPVISHLGAVINFAAGNVTRAPLCWQRFGFEWLWRIKEEPALWRRYSRDGLQFLQLLLTQILPYAALVRWPGSRKIGQPILRAEPNGVFKLEGPWIKDNLGPLKQALCDAHRAYHTHTGKGTTPIVTLDLQGVSFIDSYGIGLIMLARGVFAGSLRVCGTNALVTKIFKCHLAEYLLA